MRLKLGAGVTSTRRTYKIMRKSSNTTLFCFSPPVMLATILIELVLLVWALVKYKRSSALAFAAAILLSLAMFQVAEFRTCGNVLGEAGLAWSHIGYIFITLLPPLGLHLISAIAKKKPTKLHWLADGSALLLITIFGLVPSSLYYAVCGGNYVIYRLHHNLGFVYGVYYLGLLFVGIILAARYMTKATKAQYAALLWMIIGYLIFLVPTGVVNMLNPATTAGVPSIMCGFAVFYALILKFAILPRVAHNKHNNK